MTVQQIQEMIIELSVSERLQIAHWLNDRALWDDPQLSPTSEPYRSADQEQNTIEESVRSNGSTESSQADENNLTASSHLPQSSTVAREKQAYYAMHQDIWTQYPRQHVAIYQGQLIDHDEDGIALSRRIYAQYPEEFVLIKKVEPQPEQTLRFRSPRFVQENISGS